MRCTGVYAVVLVLFAVTGQQVAGRAGQRVASGAAAGDARLLRSVKLEQVGGSLADYLELLTERSAVRHAAKPPLGEQALLALNIDMSLQRLQRGLARATELSWQASGEPRRYTLEETKRDREARSAARTATLVRARQEMIRRWDEQRRILLLPEPALRRLIDSGQLPAHPYGSSEWSANRKLVFQLPEPVLRQFWATGSARVALRDLPPGLQRLAEDGAPVNVRDPGIIGREGQLQLALGGTLARPTVWAMFKYGRDGVTSNVLYNEGWTRQPPADRRQGLIPSKPPGDRRFKERVTVRDPIPRPKPPTLPPGTRVMRVEQGERPPKAAPLAVLLQQVAEQVDVPILAECEYEPKKPGWSNRQWWLAADIVDEPLTRALDLLCADFEYEWRFSEGMLLLRPRLWFAQEKERQYVVPEPK